MRRISVENYVISSGKRSKGLKRWSLMLIVLASCLLAACGKSGSSNNQLAKEYVYSYQDIDLGDDSEYPDIRFAQCVQDKVSMLFLITESGGGINDLMPRVIDTAYSEASAVAMPEMPVESTNHTTLRLMTCNTDGSNVNHVDLATGREEESNSWVNFSTMSTTGDVYVVWGVTVESPNATPENPMTEDQQIVACYSGTDGSLLWESPIENLEVEEDSYSYIMNMQAAEDGNLYLVFSTGNTTYSMVTITSQGEIKEIKKIDSEDASNINNIYMKADGSLLLVGYNDDYTKAYAAVYDTKTGTVGAKQDIAINIYNYNVYPAPSTLGVDFLLTSNTGIYTYSVGDTEVKQTMSFLNSDFPASYVQDLSVIDNDHMLLIYSDSTENKTRAAYLTKVLPEDIPDKEVLVLGQNGLGMDMSGWIREFNKTNEKYRIVVKDYSQYATMDDYNASDTQMNNDIISGNMPDIMVFNYNNSKVNNYITKGLFVDFKKMLQEDEELSKVEYLENVFRAASSGDEWYVMVPGFGISTVVGKTSILGDRTGWNMTEFNELMDSLPPSTKSFAEMTKSNFLYMMMYYCANDFMDPSTGKCNFNSQEFIDMLEYANTFPDEINYDNYDDNYWNNYQEQYMNGETILQQNSLYSVMNYKNLFGSFGEDVSFVGFPTESKKGSVIEYSLALAISSKSKHKEGAWEFVRTFLMDDYQKNNNYGMPVKKDVFLEKAAEAMERPYYLDENGQKVEYDDYNYINGEQVIIPPMNQEQVDKTVAFIESVDNMSYYEDEINNIITEETEAFFKGQKSAAEVADIIQSRVQLYVNENR
jgi:hypothetical protein